MECYNPEIIFKSLTDYFEYLGYLCSAFTVKRVKLLIDLGAKIQVIVFNIKYLEEFEMKSSFAFKI